MANKKLTTLQNEVLTPKYAKYRVKNAEGKYEIVYLETDMNQVEGLNEAIAQINSDIESAESNAIIAANENTSSEIERVEGVISELDTAYKAADTLIEERLDVLESNTSDLSSVKDQVEANKQAIAKEVTDRTEAISTVDSKITDEISRATSAEEALGLRIDGIDAAYKSADSETLNSAKAYADSQDTAKLLEAKAYTDQAVAGLVDGAPEALNTLKELADALEAHEDAYDALLQTVGLKAEKTYVDEEISKINATTSGLDSDITALEGTVSALDSAYKLADSQLSSRITTLEEVVNGEDGIANIKSDLEKAKEDILANTSAIGAETVAREAAVSEINTTITNNMTIVSSSQPIGTLTGHVWLEIVE